MSELITNQEQPTEEPVVIQPVGLNLEDIQREIEKALSSIPANSSSIQLMIYGFDCESSQVTDKTPFVYEAELALDISAKARIGFLKQAVSDFLIAAPNYENTLSSEEIADEEKQQLLHNLKLEAAKLRLSLTEIASDIETHDEAVDIVKDLFGTLLQANCPQVWAATGSVFNSPKKAPEVTAIFVEVQWGFASGNAKSAVIKKPLKGKTVTNATINPA